MVKCEVCKKPIDAEDFLTDAFTGDPMYWRQIGGVVHVFCGPQHSSEWHKQESEKAGK